MQKKENPFTGCVPCPSTRSSLSCVPCLLMSVSLVWKNHLHFPEEGKQAQGS